MARPQVVTVRLARQPHHAAVLRAGRAKAGEKGLPAGRTVVSWNRRERSRRAGNLEVAARASVK